VWRIRRLLSQLTSVPETDGHREIDDVAYTRLIDPASAHPQDARLFPRETNERYLSNYIYHVAPVWHFVETSTMFDHTSASGEGNRSEYASQLRRIQFNLVMAIGKLLEHGGKYEQSPGESHFYMALSLSEKMSESMSIAREPILVAQNLCLIAFYYHAINMRNNAYINV
jgi:hypothetical protein